MVEGKLWRYYLIPFVIFILIYWLRFQQTSCIKIASGCLKIDKLVEINTNLYLKISGSITSVPVEKDDYWIFNLGQVKVKTSKVKKNQKLYYGQPLRVVGKPEVRVTNLFFREIWLINPEVYIYDLASKNEVNYPPKSRFFTSNLVNNAIIFFNFIRLKSQEIYTKVLPEPQGSLLAGIVLGTSEFLGWQFWQALKKTGTLHIIAASGMNVTLVSKVTIDSLVSFINRRQAYFVSLVFIFIYCMLAGASPAVIRAGVMAALSLLGLAFGRETQAGWLLFLAAALMLLVNPLLLFDISFQLSATAMAGMIYIRPILKKTTEIIYRSFLKKKQVSVKKSNPGWLRPIFSNNLLDTLSAQIGTFPVLYFTFGQWQPLAFIPNLFVVPLVPILMMLGFLILVLGLIWLPLAYPIAWLVWPPLTYFVAVIQWWAKVL